MTGNSPISGKNSSQKQNGNEPNKCNRNKKVTNDMSLLSMWKIEGSEKPSKESAEDDVFLLSKDFKTTPKRVKAWPKKPKISPKLTTSTGSDGSNNDILDYCPNCQMPFAALIKQSQNWHLTECMDFEFSHLKECPAGELCSSTIPSHYLKYTHYGLARFRSGIPQNPKNSSTSEKCHSSTSSGKIKSETLTPPTKPRSSFQKQSDSSLSQNVSPITSHQHNHSDSSVSMPSYTNPIKSKSSCLSTLSDGAKEKFNQSVGLFGSFIQPENCHLSSGTCSKQATSGTLGKSFTHSKKSMQELKITNNVPSKPLGLGIIAIPKAGIKSEPGGNQNRVLESKQCKRVLSNVIQTGSPVGKEATNPRTSGSSCSIKLCEGSLDSSKKVNCYEQRNVKRMKLSDSLSKANNFLQSDDSFDVSGTRLASKDLDSGICSQCSTPNRQQLNHVCSKPSSCNGTNFNDPQQDTDDISDLAREWFAFDEFDSGDSSDLTKKNSGPNCGSEEELFVSKEEPDLSKKTMVQTVITKTTSLSDNGFNITLSPVKPEKLTPQKKVKSMFLTKSSSSSAKTEPLASPRKKQTSLMSFFKSSSSHVGNTQKVTFVEPPSSVDNNKPVQNRWGKFFQGRKTFNNENQEQNELSSSVQGNRKCPFYKKIPGTTFAVDAFSYGSVPGIQHYFLSHFHSDHYKGLTKNFHHPVYCTVVTANLVTMKIRLPQKYINILKMNETTIIENVEVTVLDANHCPGSVMFLFGLPGGRFILHTGDFRATPAMELYPSLKSCKVERLFLDTTYCNPRYDFPSQESVLDMLTSLVVPRMKNNAKLLVVCGSYTIGKERAFMAIAESINCKVWAEPSKRSILKRLEDHRISSRLVTVESQAKIHVRPMWTIKVSYLLAYLSKFPGVFNEIIGLKPTGWEHTSGGPNKVFSLKPVSQGPVTIYGVPYSEHSSFSELKRFVQFLNPAHIVPTVNVGNAQCRSQMASYFKEWCIK